MGMLHEGPCLAWGINPIIVLSTTTPLLMHIVSCFLMCGNLACTYVFTCFVLCIYYVSPTSLCSLF